MRKRTKCVVLSVVLFLAVGAAQSADFFVTSTGDEGDGNPGNGFCATPGPGVATCTLRAAVEEANALPGQDRVFVGSSTIQLGAPELLITDHLIIQGNGAYETVLLGNPDAPTRILHIQAPSVVSIRDLSLRGAAVDVLGGAIRSRGSLGLFRVWLDGNSASGCGAVATYGFTLIRDSTFTRNDAENRGGAICFFQGDLAIVENSTFVRNSALLGGAINLSHQDAILELYSSTLVDNVDKDPESPPTSSAIFISDGSLHVDKTLIAGTCQNNGLATTSNGGNIESPGDTCFPSAPSNIADVSRRDLDLGTLGDYGGPVPTVLPGAASWAVDPGLSPATCPEFDARGEPRQGSCDVGAAERQLDDPDSGPLFYDDLESGDTSWWSSSSP